MAFLDYTIDIGGYMNDSTGIVDPIIKNGGLYILKQKTNAKSNIKLFGNERSDRFHVAGMGTDLRTSLNMVFWKNWMLRVEGKAGYINMWDIKTTLNNKPDKARQDFVFGQVLAGIGYTFNTKKYN